MLTALLILLMLGVAAFASIFLDDGLAGLFRAEPRTAVATARTPEAAGDASTQPAQRQAARDAIAEPVSEVALALPDSGATPDLEVPIDIAALSQGIPVLSARPGNNQIDGLSVPVAKSEVSPEQAQARYAATGIWQRAPAPPDDPPPGIVDDLYVASIDPKVAVGDAVTIPNAREAITDFAPTPQSNPYPPDKGYTFDDNGLIEPTPDGVLHPDGFMLITGPPPLKPPLRSGVEQIPQSAALPDVRPATKPEGIAPAPGNAGTLPEPEAGLPGAGPDPTLAGLRARLRPSDLIEQNERANLGGISREEFRQKRPQLRPEQEARKIEAEKNTAASALAVARSISPRKKPSNIKAMVAKAQRNTPAAPVVRAAAAGTVAPRTVTPRIPSKTSVARAATQTNAINLRRVNLIGVYGTASSRRALIRLGNGRYKKVKVGDRIDGGRVASISDGKLSYVKSGRNIVLRMPRG